MPDRADYLARTLVERLRAQEAWDASTHSAHRLSRTRDVVAKLLAVELGVVDEQTLQRVADGLPVTSPHSGPAERDLVLLAQLLRQVIPALA